MRNGRLLRALTALCFLTSLARPCRAENGVSPWAALAQAEDAAYRGNLEGARQTLKSSFDENPDVYALALRYAYYSYLLKDYAAAGAAYVRARELGPKEEAPRAGLLIAAQAQGDAAKVRESAQGVLEVNPADRNALIALAFDDIANKRYDPAITRCADVLQQNPDDPDALLGSGWSYYYQGKYTKARKYFSRVLSNLPGNAYALEGLRLTQQTAWVVGAGYFRAALSYSNNLYKESGSGDNFPLSISYRNRFGVNALYSKTKITWKNPSSSTDQKEFIPGFFWNILPALTLTGAYDMIDVNDPATDNGKIQAGGLHYSPVLNAQRGLFLSLGAAASTSDYDAFEVTQTTPHLGFGGWGRFYADVFMTNMKQSVSKESRKARGAALVVGPLGRFVLNGKFYTGEKKMSVEDGGTVVFNNTDLYRGGWKAGVSWNMKNASLFVSLGLDKVRANYARLIVDYTAKSTVAGLNVRFGS